MTSKMMIAPTSLSPRIFALMMILGLTLGLTACLGDQDARTAKIRRIACWEDRRLAPEDSLRSMFHDGDAHVRLAVARAAGLIGRDDAVTPLVELLNDPSLTIRAQACFSLGLLGGDQAVETLGNMVADPHPEIRSAALAALAQAPGGGPALLEATKIQDPALAATAWDGLRNRVDELDHTALVAAILGGLTQADPSVRWRVLRCAELVPDSTLVPAISPLATSSNVQVRVHAYRALGHQKDRPALTTALESAPGRKSFRGRNRQRVDIALCGTLGALGPLALDTPPGQDPSPAALEITRILITAAGDQEPHVSRAALNAMTRCVENQDLPDAAAKRESLLPVWRIRMVRAAAGLMESSHLGVRCAAVEAWATLRGSGSAAKLADILATAQDPRVKIAALKAVADVHPDPLLLLLPMARADRKSPFPGSAASQTISPSLRVAALEAVDQVLTQRPAALPAGLDSSEARKRIATVIRRASLDSDFVVAATTAGLLAHYPDSLTVDALAAMWRRSTGPEGFEIQRGVIKGLAGMGPDKEGLLGAPSRKVCAEILQEGFDSRDLRIRMEGRATALATGLVPAELIPSEASLRATLPPVIRSSAQPPVTTPFKAPKVHVVTERGTFTIALDGMNAPNTCAVFLDLIAKGFYDDLTFHRVVPDFVIQGGDPRGDGWGGPGYTIRSEWSMIPFQRGVVGIAHDGKDTGGSQFFVTLSEQPHLNGRYTVFGKVTAGMDVVDRMEVGDHFKLEVIP